VSAVEHPSVLKARSDVGVLAVDEQGRVQPDELPDDIDLLSVMLANNETGVVQPVGRAAKRARERRALVHCDAVQAAGRMAIDMQRLGLDMLSLSAHKIGGPQGIGALVVRDGTGLTSRLHGGGQERGLRAGTENVAGIVGFGVAADIARRELDRMADLGPLRDRLERSLPEARVLGAGADRLPNTSCLAMPGVAADAQLMAFDLDGIMVSSGSACSSGKVAKSHVLAAMGVADELAACAIRVSLGWTTTDIDIDRLIAAWRALHLRTRERVREVA
jgi:cysteine desulfurase